MAKVEGYVFMEVDPGRVADAVDSIARIEGVKSVCAVTGRYDVLANVEAEEFAERANTVLPQVRKVEGVRSTETALVIPEPREEL